MNFGKEYTSAVEAKQIAQQMAERARFKVEQAQQEKKGTIILAEGEAESAKLIGEAVRDNKGIYHFLSALLSAIYVTTQATKKTAHSVH